MQVRARMVVPSKDAESVGHCSLQVNELSPRSHFQVLSRSFVIGPQNFTRMVNLSFLLCDRFPNSAFSVGVLGEVTNARNYYVFTTVMLLFRSDSECEVVGTS
jgi:hypothetical protein